MASKEIQEVLLAERNKIIREIIEKIHAITRRLNQSSTSNNYKTKGVI